jgi:hypothetical protein
VERNRKRQVLSPERNRKRQVLSPERYTLVRVRYTLVRVRNRNLQSAKKTQQ